MIHGIILPLRLNNIAPGVYINPHSLVSSLAVVIIFFQLDMVHVPL